MIECSSEWNQEWERGVVTPAAPTQPPLPPTKTPLVCKYKVDPVFESSSEWERRVLHPTPSTLRLTATPEPLPPANHNREPGGSVGLEPVFDPLSPRGEEEMSSHVHYEQEHSPEALVYTLHPAPAALPRDLRLEQLNRYNGSRGGVGRGGGTGHRTSSHMGTSGHVGTPDHMRTPQGTPGQMSTLSIVPKDLTNLDKSNNVSGGRGGEGGVPGGHVASVSSLLVRSPSAEWRRFENMHFVSSPSPRPEGVCVCVCARARACVCPCQCPCTRGVCERECVCVC